MDFGRVWAPFWEVFRFQERKSGFPERFEKQAEKEGDKKSRRPFRPEGGPALKESLQGVSPRESLPGSLSQGVSPREALPGSVSQKISPRESLQRGVFPGRKSQEGKEKRTPCPHETPSATSAVADTHLFIWETC